MNNFILELKEDGTWTYYVDLAIIESGTYIIQDNELTVMVDNVGDTKEPKSTTYEWTYQNDILTLKVKGADCCKERFHYLSGYLDLNQFMS